MTRGCVTLLLLLDVISCYNVVRKDPFASLSETLVTRQRAACDGDILVLECPARTKISIQLVIYGRSAPSSQVCPPTNKQPRIYTSYEGLSCTIKEALRTVEELCQGQESCSILTSPSSFGVSEYDKCPGIRKYIEVVYKCHPTSYSSRQICGGQTKSLSCGAPGEGIAIFSAKFQAAGTMSMYCPLRREIMESALDRGKEETAVTMKKCERADVTPGLVSLCHGAEECQVRAEPGQLDTPQCSDQHVALKIAFACMNKENFLPSFFGTNSVIEKENSEEEVYSVIRPTSNSLPPLPPPPQPDKTFPETFQGNNNQSPDQMPSFDTKSESESVGEGALLAEEKAFRETEKSSWLLKIIYNIVSGGELIIKLVQSDQWKLILSLSLSLGLGLSCCLLVCILRLCRLYSEKVTQPRASEGEMNQRQKIDLDSESVLDYDINTALYTPLPEPRIMQVSGTSPSSEEPRVHPDQSDALFGFSTLTRNKSKSSKKSSTISNVDQYLLQGDQKDSVVRYSTIGRNSRGHQNMIRAGADFNASGNFEPKSLNLSQENNYLYY